MAVDTRDKRASCIGFDIPFRVYPNPTGTSTSSFSGRQQIGLIYAGIDTTFAPPASFSQTDQASFFTMSDGYSVTGGGDRYSTITVSSGFSFFGV